MTITPPGSSVEEVLQTVGQALFLGQLFHALCADHRQLAFKLGHPGFKQAVRIGPLAGHLVDQRKGLF